MFPDGLKDAVDVEALAADHVILAVAVGPCAGRCRAWGNHNRTKSRWAEASAERGACIVARRRDAGGFASRLHYLLQVVIRRILSHPFHREFIPSHLLPTDADQAAIAANGAGPPKSTAKNAVNKCLHCSTNGECCRGICFKISMAFLLLGQPISKRVPKSLGCWATHPLRSE